MGKKSNILQPPLGLPSSAKISSQKKIYDSQQFTEITKHGSVVVQPMTFFQQMDTNL